MFNAIDKEQIDYNGLCCGAFIANFKQIQPDAFATDLGRRVRRAKNILEKIKEAGENVLPYCLTKLLPMKNFGENFQNVRSIHPLVSSYSSF